MRYILSIDTGLENGISLGTYSDDEPLQFLKSWQFGGGAYSLVHWVRDNLPLPYVGLGARDVTVVCEKFVPVPGGNFHFTLDSLEPLRCEGALIALDVMPDYKTLSGKVVPEWRRAASMYVWGGKTKAEKLKAARKALKDRGAHLTGKDVGRPNADDALSSRFHAISYLAQVAKHKPTFDYWLDGEVD